MILRTCSRLPNLCVPYLIMASYLYYIMDEAPPLEDYAFDRLCRIAARNWSRIQHPHKRLIKRAWLDAGSLYQLRPKDYPLRVRAAAMAWLDLYQSPIGRQLERIRLALESLVNARNF